MRSPEPSFEEAAALASIIPLEQGLFAIHIAPFAAAIESGRALPLPRVQVSRFPSPGLADVDILGEDGLGEPWFGPPGGVAVVRSPPGGGAILVTMLAPPANAPALPGVTVQRLDREVPADGSPAVAAPPASPAPQLPVTPLDVLLHVERLGDCRFGGEGWMGNRGQRLRVEGFTINPLAGLMAEDLEYKAFQPDGAETPWIGAPRFCGSRGRRLPLTGFAIRVAPAVAEQFDVVYSGAFVNGGVTGPLGNGEPCRPALPDDTLEAITIRIVERGPA